MTTVSDNVIRPPTWTANLWARWHATHLRALVTRDYCPALNPWLKWLKHPLVVLLLAATTSLAAGWTINPQGFVIAGTLGAVILIGITWPKIVMRGLSGELHFRRDRAREGEAVEAVLRVRNRWPFPVWGIALEHGFRCRETNAENSDADAVELALACVPGWSGSEFVWNFVPSRRGSYPLAAPRLTSSFPFGLIRTSQEVAVTSRLTVWPHIVPLEELYFNRGGNWITGGLNERCSGHDGETIGLRPFRPGDTQRQVHWTQTARQGQLIVRERQVPATGRVRVVLDGDPIVHAACAGESSLDWCVRFVASIVQVCEQSGADVECVLDGKAYSVPLGPTGLRRINDWLALYQCGGNEAAPKQELQTGAEADGSFSERPRRIGGASRTDILVILVTTDLGANRAPEMLGAGGCILLDTSAWRQGEIRDLSKARSLREIVIDDPRDPAQQFRREWEQEFSQGRTHAQ